MFKPDPKKETWKRLFQTTEVIRNYHALVSGMTPKGDITLSQIRVLGCIIFAEHNACMVKDIAKELNITAGGVSQIVNTLVKRGLLVRHTDPKDRRAVQIKLSTLGLQKSQEFNESFQGTFESLLENVSPDEQAIFKGVLDQILLTVDIKKKSYFEERERQKEIMKGKNDV